MSTADDDNLPERQFAWSNMFVTHEDDPRTESGPADERKTLVEYLRNYRLTLEMKCVDLDAEAMAKRSVPPSTMSLLGIVRHLAGVEQYWFRINMAVWTCPGSTAAARTGTRTSTAPSRTRTS